MLTISKKLLQLLFVYISLVLGADTAFAENPQEAIVLKDKIGKTTLSAEDNDAMKDRGTPVFGQNYPAKAINCL